MRSRLRRTAAALGMALSASGLCTAESLAVPRLTVRLRDATTATPTACRLQVDGPSGSVFGAPDPVLRTHQGGGLAPYVLAEDSVSISVPPGSYRIRAVRGITGIPVELTALVQTDTTLTVSLDRWIDPRADGWIAGDPHVHPAHPPSQYPTATPAIAAIAARAEALEVVALLANDAGTPGGPVTPAQAGVSLMWGEEFRSGFWGHAILLGLPQLVLSAYGAGCCDPGQPAWPTLTSMIAPAAPPLAIVAHPHSTDAVFGSGGWPHTGLARELPALALQPFVHGLAVASASNGPSPWDLQDYRDGIAVGAHWAAIGESDMTLDRFSSSPPGWPRTYALIDTPAPAGTAVLGAQWQDALRAGRSFATQGPMVREVRVGGVLPGTTATLGAPGPVAVHLRAASWFPMQAVRIYGVAGVLWSATWPGGRGVVDTTVTLTATGDDAWFVELSAAAGSWYAPVDTVRAVTTPVWIDTGAPRAVPAAAARRGVDRLSFFWQRSVVERGYASAQESVLARNDVLNVATVYEAMVDDPPGPFQLIAPAEGDTLPVASAALRWHSAPSYDGEPTTYRVELDVSPLFTLPQEFDAGSDTSLTVASLAAGQTYWWRIAAQEPGEGPRLNEPPDGSFTVDPMPVSALPHPGTALRLSTPWIKGDGVVRLHLTLGLPATVTTRWVDLRGRVVFAPPAAALDAGEHLISWDGRDGRGGRAAAGIYWLVAQAGELRATRRVLLGWR